MADLSRNVPSAMADLRGHIARRVADRSTNFFNMRTAWYRTTGKRKYKENLGRKD